MAIRRIVKDFIEIGRIIEYIFAIGFSDYFKYS